MNILMLNYEYPPIGGGGAAVTKELCEQIESHGGNVDVVTMGFRGLQTKETHGKITIHRVKCWRSKQRVCHPWEQLSYCINAFFYIKRNIDVRNYDVVHCHFIIPTGILALWLKKKYGINYIITSHGSDVLGHNNARFSALYKIITPEWKKILKKASAITAPSEYLIGKIREKFPGAEVKLVPNGINAGEYVPGEKKKNIITMTRLQESKGVQDLIEACSSLDMNGWEVNILGDGPFRYDLEKKASEMEVNEFVHFRGHVEGEERIEYLSQAGCFFSGSRFESFSMSVLEASLCGCNVIASNIEPHVLLVGRAHTYVEMEGLKKMLSDVISKEPRIIKYENEKYDWKNIYGLYENLYRKVMYDKKDTCNH